MAFAADAASLRRSWGDTKDAVWAGERPAGEEYTWGIDFADMCAGASLFANNTYKKLHITTWRCLQKLFSWSG